MRRPSISTSPGSPRHGHRPDRAPSPRSPASYCWRRWPSSPGVSAITGPPLTPATPPLFCTPLPPLPTGPRALLARLRAHAVIEAADPGQETLLLAAAALERGVPHSLPARVYRALALMPGLKPAHDRVVLTDGRTGTAVSLDSGGARVELALDPRTGAFLGWRRVLTAAENGLPPGTVTIMKVVRRTVVGAVGDLSGPGAGQ